MAIIKRNRNYLLVFFEPDNTEFLHYLRVGLLSKENTHTN